MRMYVCVCVLVSPFEQNHLFQTEIMTSSTCTGFWMLWITRVRVVEGRYVPLREWAAGKTTSLRMYGANASALWLTPKLRCGIEREQRSWPTLQAQGIVCGTNFVRRRGTLILQLPLVGFKLGATLWSLCFAFEKLLFASWNTFFVSE